MDPKTIDDYLDLPYTVEVIRNEDGFFARVEELPGCMTWTNRSEDVWPMIQDAMRAWIDDALEDGDPIPEPEPDHRADRMVVRLPDDVHRKLRRRASETGMSVGQLVASTLTHAMAE